jgi:YesN/AraC family two-component response regulator
VLGVIQLKNLISIGNVINCEHINTHSHTIWEMIYYTKGKVKLTVDEKEYELSDGVFVCQPPFLSHSEDGIKTFNNYFFCVSNYDLLPNKLIIVKDTVNKVIKHLIQQMYYTFNTKPTNYALICEAQLNLIVQYVISQISSNNMVNPYVEKFALALLSNASNCNFKISDIVGDIPFSFDYFRLLFKKEMSCTPIDYLNKIRISNAKNLINNRFYQGNLSFATISRMCGFLDPLYFSRSFKKHTGMSPSEWSVMNKGGL